jgi:hypothetical protein
MESDQSFPVYSRKRAVSCPLPSGSEIIVLNKNNKLNSKNTLVNETQSLPGMRKLIYEGRQFKFNKRVTAASGDFTYYYKCANLFCPSKLLFRSKNWIFVLKNRHKCNIVQENQNPFEQLIQFEQVTSEVERLVQYHARNPAMPPQQVYEVVLNSLSEMFGNFAYNPPLKEQVKASLRKARGIEKGILEIIESPPLSNTKLGLPFFRGKSKIFLRDGFQQFVFWASSETINLLRGSDQFFIDGTFRCVPKPFNQLLVIMGHHKVTKVHVPGIYILMESKDEAAYKFIFNLIIEWIGIDDLPKFVTCDFEQALLNSVLKIFPPATQLVGCFYHFKQALRRKLVSLGAVQNSIEYIMNIVNVVTIVEEEDVLIFLTFLNEKVVGMFPNMSDTITAFINYFKSYWIARFKFWSLHKYLENDVNRFKRTDNCLERYNRRLNEKFSTPHPSLAQFVDTLISEEYYYTQYVRSITSGVQVHSSFPDFELPSKTEFLRWVNEKNMKLNISPADEKENVHQGYSHVIYRDADGNECGRGYVPANFDDDDFRNEELLDEAQSVLSCPNSSNQDDGRTYTESINVNAESVSLTQHGMTDEEMRTYIVDKKKCRVGVLRRYLVSKGIDGQNMKKASLVESIKNMI